MVRGHHFFSNTSKSTPTPHTPPAPKTTLVYSHCHVTPQVGWTALMWASFLGNEDIVELLLSYEADANVATYVS